MISFHFHKKAEYPRSRRSITENIDIQRYYNRRQHKYKKFLLV